MPEATPNSEAVRERMLERTWRGEGLAEGAVGEGRGMGLRGRCVGRFLVRWGGLRGCVRDALLERVWEGGLGGCV